MVMANLHIICGNCGSRDFLRFYVSPNGNCGCEGEEYPAVRISCKNCGTLHSLEDTITNDDAYTEIRKTITATLAERDELKADMVIAKTHLEQKDHALAANAKEYKELEQDLKICRGNLIASCELLDRAEAERDEARERVKELESSLRIAETVRKAGNKALAAQLDTSWQQGAEAFREAAVNICYERAQNQGSNQCRYAGDDIYALPVPERKEG